MSSDEAEHWETTWNIRLEEIMHPGVTVTPDTTEREVLKVLLENEIPGVSVVDEEGLLVGFVTDGHLLDSAMPDYLKIMEDVSFVAEAGDEWIDYFAGSADSPVKEVMNTQVASVDVKDSEIVAAHKMVHEGVSSVVVTDDGEVVGIVNRLDLYAAIIGASPEE
ncbi:MAG: CBS domain-containing protein [Actinomycetota bacterium]|nr:CBS domain-containing protein [Actinomycetota bacterium]